MPYILNIHTATETAIINLVLNNEVIDTLINHDTKLHASFLHTSIQDLLKKNKVAIKRLSAIGVSVGPGSYTGIRVGLAAAKGLSYALHCPLISYNSLELMADTSARLMNNPQGLFCPMIDARREEVYTAIYKYNMEELLPPEAMILDENSLADILMSNTIYFSGSGSHKFQNIVKHQNAVFINADISAESLCKISWQKFEKNEFENLAYAKPLYIKDFHTILKK